MNTVIMIAVVSMAFVFCIGFLLLLFSLIPAIRQFRSFVADAEKTSGQIREFCLHLEKLSEHVDEGVGHAENLLHSARRVMDNTGETLDFVNNKILKKTAAWLAFLPAIRMGWKIVKKFQGGK